MSNRRHVEAFGGDKSHESRGAVTTGDIPSYEGTHGHDKAGNKLADEARPGNGKRVVRAFHDQPRSKTGGMQQDHERHDEEERQFAHTGEAMTDGGNSSGRVFGAVFPSIVSAFQGRSGTPDNQSTYRPKGST